MMNKIAYIIICCSIISLWSCEDFFTTTVNIDPPESTPKLSISAFWDAQDTVLLAFAAGSTDIFSGNRFDGEFGLDGVDMELFAEGNSLGTFELLEDPLNPVLTEGNYVLFLEKPLKDFGSSFEIRASHPDYPSIKAVQTIPTKVEPSNYRFVSNAGVDEYGYPTKGVEITFQDPAGENNFYEAAIFFRDSFFNPDPAVVDYYFINTWNTTVDPNGTQGPNYNNIFINGQGIDGTEHKLTVRFETYEDSSDDIIVIFNSISEERYRFATSLRAFYDSQDFGPFGEPVSIYSNFENGLGTFGLGNINITEIGQ